MTLALGVAFIVFLGLAVLGGLMVAAYDLGLRRGWWSE